MTIINYLYESTVHMNNFTTVHTNTIWYSTYYDSSSMVV